MRELTFNDEEDLLDGDRASVTHPASNGHDNPYDSRDEVDHGEDDRTCSKGKSSIVRAAVAVLTAILHGLTAVLTSTHTAFAAAFAAEGAGLAT